MSEWFRLLLKIWHYESSSVFLKLWVSSNPRLHQYIDSRIFYKRYVQMPPFFFFLDWINLLYGLQKFKKTHNFFLLCDLWSLFLTQRNSGNVLRGLIHLIYHWTVCCCLLFSSFAAAAAKKNPVYLQINTVFDSLQHRQSNICTLLTREHRSPTASAEIWES